VRAAAVRSAIGAVALASATLVGSSPAAAMDLDAAARAEKVLREQIDAAGIPGAGLVVVDSDGAMVARGLGDTGDGRRVTGATPFVIGSTSKSVTALAVMQLVDDGRVDVDAPVRQYVPELQLADPAAADAITVRQVLQQTSGLPETAGGLVMKSAADGAALDAVRELRDTTTVDPPGEEWHYANANYVLAGLVVERASGLDYAEYVERRIFTPLGMTRSARPGRGRASSALPPGTADGSG
jgi:CubicO group peptidase (beta-lactamase class C family)